MKRITLICYGRLKTTGLQEAVAEFTKRLTRFTDFQVMELKPVPVPEKSIALRDQIPEKEGQELLNLLASPAFRQKAGRLAPFWCLDETGQAMKTTEWAREIADITDRGPGELILVIGGSLGLGSNILKAAQKKISLGPQTLSHELARLILIEQVYRALSFNQGHPYHNEG